MLVKVIRIRFVRYISAFAWVLKHSRLQTVLNARVKSVASDMFLSKSPLKQSSHGAMTHGASRDKRIVGQLLLAFFRRPDKMTASHEAKACLLPVALRHRSNNLKP